MRRLMNMLRSKLPRRQQPPGHESPGPLAAEINAGIVRLYEAGSSQREIAAELGVSKGRIYRVLQARKMAVRHGE